MTYRDGLFTALKRDRPVALARGRDSGGGCRHGESSCDKACSGKTRASSLELELGSCGDRKKRQRIEHAEAGREKFRVHLELHMRL